MTNKTFKTFANLAVSWINDGSDRQGQYGSGLVDFDLGYGASETCQWYWEATSLRSGLHFVRCKACGSEGHIQVSGGNGTVKLACNLLKVPT